MFLLKKAKIKNIFSLHTDFLRLEVIIEWPLNKFLNQI